ncbi:hypothetical protein MnTg02_00008 [bacterium MnTg02]|nr:hypothetical protein MnTg02_00008 [bacterium MnTg02]
MIARVAIAIRIQRHFDGIRSQGGRARHIAKYLERQYGCTGRHTDTDFTQDTQPASNAGDVAAVPIDIERVGIGDWRAERGIAGIIYRPGKVETADDLRRRESARLDDIRIVSRVVRRQTRPPQVGMGVVDTRIDHGDRDAGTINVASLDRISANPRYAACQIRGVERHFRDRSHPDDIAKIVDPARIDADSKTVVPCPQPGQFLCPQCGKLGTDARLGRIDGGRMRFLHGGARYRSAGPYLIDAVRGNRRRL